VAAAVEELGVLAVRQGHVQYGVELLAGAAAQRQTMGVPVRPADRHAFEDTLAAARAALGSAAFADAWATGQALPVERLVARALADPLAPQLPPHGPAPAPAPWPP
jgi:hypothetical protein